MATDREQFLAKSMQHFKLAKQPNVEKFINLLILSKRIWCHLCKQKNHPLLPDMRSSFISVVPVRRAL